MRAMVVSKIALLWEMICFDLGKQQQGMKIDSQSVSGDLLR